MSAIARLISRQHRQLVSQSGALLATTVLNAGIGFLFWWLAARTYAPAAVGLASAAIALMMLISTFGVLGMTTVLLGELPRRQGPVGPLVIASLLAVGGVSFGLGSLAGLSSILTGWPLQEFVRSAPELLLFAGGVAVTSVAMVADQVCVGLSRSDVQLWRNVAASTVKLLLLLALVLVIPATEAAAPFVAFAFANLLSLAVLPLVAGPARRAWRSRPDWGALRMLRTLALRHHVFNLIMTAPGLLIPVLVASLLDPVRTGAFYVAWMLASALWMVPTAIATVLHAAAAGDPHNEASIIRRSLGLAFAASGAAGLLVALLADPVLRVFGPSYADHAAGPLQLLALVAVPSVVKAHYMTVARLRDRVREASRVMLAFGVMEVLAAALGLLAGGLQGFALAMLAVVTLEALLMYPAVRAAQRS